MMYVAGGAVGLLVLWTVMKKRKGGVDPAVDKEVRDLIAHLRDNPPMTPEDGMQMAEELLQRYGGQLPNVFSDTAILLARTLLNMGAPPNMVRAANDAAALSPARSVAAAV